MSIPFYLQYYVEQARSKRHSQLVVGVLLGAFVLYNAIYFIAGYRLKARGRWRTLWQPVILIQKRLRYVHRFGFVSFDPALTILVLVYFAMNGLLVYTKTSDITYEANYYIVGKRVGRIAVANLPPMYIMSIKNNPFAHFAGLSHEKLNVLHRIMGLFVFCLVMLHIGFGIKYWYSLGFTYYFKIPPTIFGYIAYSMMGILCVGGLLRHFGYEIFVISHTVAGLLFLVTIYFHSEENVKPYVVSSTLIAGLDRTSRWVKGFYLRQQATVIALPDAIELNVRCTKYRWKAGSHIFVRIPKARFGQWHPFTIASVSSLDGSAEENMRLLIRPRKGITKRLAKLAGQTVAVHVDGFYGGNYRDLSQFRSVILIAGGSGASFTVPLAISQCHRESEKPSTDGRRLRFVFMVQRPEHVDWYRSDLRTISNEFEVDIYVTRASLEELPRDDITFEPINSASDSGNTSDHSVTSEKNELVLQDSSVDQPMPSRLRRGCIRYHSGRPDIYNILDDFTNAAEHDETVAVAACGALSLADTVRRFDARSSRPMYIYTEQFDM
ncbi:ferric reductase NAD binding domain-containing protein [Dipodascopsis tothii]|uniref:ferric reductase NAD binding domain-containing protein n=1 Tax=Dipodascopsis tothii TaxID=44089 RepID=UPI0034CFF05B